MNKRLLICCILSIQLLVSCKKDSGPKYDENPGSTYKGTISFFPQSPGTNATNQDESTISLTSITYIKSLNYGLDSLRQFSVSCQGKVTSTTGTVFHPFYDITVDFKAPGQNDLLKTGTYVMNITSTSGASVTAGNLAINQSVLFPVAWSGSYPAHFYSNLPYSKVTITKSYRLKLKGGDRSFADGSIEAYFVASSFSESSEVRVVGTFTGAEFH